MNKRILTIRIDGDTIIIEQVIAVVYMPATIVAVTIVIAAGGVGALDILWSYEFIEKSDSRLVLKRSEKLLWILEYFKAMNISYALLTDNVVRSWAALFYIDHRRKK